MVNEDAQVFGLFSTIAAPHCAEKRPVRDDLSGVVDQVEQQIELFRCEVYLLPADFHNSFREIHIEIADSDLCRVRRRRNSRTPQSCPDARKKLVQTEG